MAREEGIALLEVLVGAIVVAVAVIGLALMVSLGQAWVVAQGDEYVALYLAQQKIENLAACAPAPCPADCGACGLAGPGFTDGTSTQTIQNTGESATQTFTRATTVECVDPTNYTDTGVVACPTPPQAKRITVTVTPAMRQADAVTVQTVLTSH